MMKFVVLAIILAVAHQGRAETMTEGALSRKLLNSTISPKAACRVAGASYTKCYTMSFGGKVGFSLTSGKTLAVGYETSGYGWTGFAVGAPHAGASVVRNQGGKVDTVTQTGFPPSFTPGTSVKFAKVKGGKKGAKLYATFTMPFTGSSVRVTLAAGAAPMQTHPSPPRSYVLQKAGLRLV